MREDQELLRKTSKDKTELRRAKKREKIVMHYTDGSTEEYEVGVLFALEETVNENNECVHRVIGQHCNTKDCLREFNYGLAQIVMAMLENQDRLEKFYNEEE